MSALLLAATNMLRMVQNISFQGLLPGHLSSASPSKASHCQLGGGAEFVSQRGCCRACQGIQGSCVTLSRPVLPATDVRGW